MWRSRGAGAIRGAILWRTSRSVYNRRRFLVVEHDLTAGVGAPPPSGVEVRVLDERDLARLAPAMTTRTVERFRQRIGAGRTGVVAWRGARPVGFAWVSARIERRFEYLPVPLPSDGVYCWDLWVDPGERGRGVGSALAGARLSHARDAGFTRAWRLIESGNLASMRTVEKSAADPVRVLWKATYVNVLGRASARYEPPDARSGST